MITLTVTLSSKKVALEEMKQLLDIVIEDLKRMECVQHDDVAIKGFWRDYGASGRGSS